VYIQEIQYIYVIYIKSKFIWSVYPAFSSCEWNLRRWIRQPVTSHELDWLIWSISRHTKNGQLPHCTLWLSWQYFIPVACCLLPVDTRRETLRTCSEGTRMMPGYHRKKSQFLKFDPSSMRQRIHPMTLPLMAVEASGTVSTVIMRWFYHQRQRNTNVAAVIS